MQSRFNFYFAALAGIFMGFFLTPLSSLADGGGGSHCKATAESLLRECKSHSAGIANAALAAGSSATGAGGSSVGKVDQLSGTTGNASALMKAASQVCVDYTNTCHSTCDQEMAQKPEQKAQIEEDKKTCALIWDEGYKTYISAYGLDMNQLGQIQTAEAMRTGGSGGVGAGGGGGGGTMLWGLAGGAVGTLGALCLMGTICGDKDKDKKKEEPIDEAKIDCTKAENHVFQKCEAHYLNLCKNLTTGPGCGEFNELYCGIEKEESSETSTSDSASATASAGSTEGIERLASLAGVGSSFCQYQVAVDYCGDAGTEICPSCRQLQAARSPVCQQNPSLCLPGWTEEQKTQAKNYCPTDPMFISPGTVADGATDGGDTGSGSGTTVSDGTSGTVPVGSGDGQAPAESKNASLNQLSGEGTLTYGLASVNRGRSPASTLRPSLGPTLFQASSQIYQTQCQQGWLDNCGPRAGLGGSAQ